MPQKLFKRKIYDKLLEWKNLSEGSSALLIDGAKQVGKTSIALEFAKNEFSSYVYIDFSKLNKNVVTSFNFISHIDLFFQYLFLALGIESLPKGSLIIFDEIQYCPRARQAIKPLVEDGRYYYLELGSLISIKENIMDILIPSGEEHINMYPMDYEEFLWACDLDFEAQTIREHYDKNDLLNDGIHNCLMEHFRIYLAVGGMPSAVETYIKTKDLLKVDKEKRKILKMYEEHLKDIDNRYETICYKIYKQIPKMLSHSSKRFIISSLKIRPDSVLLSNTMDKLIESRLVIPVHKCTDLFNEFKLIKDRGAFKLYFNDVGLLTCILYDDEKVYGQKIYEKIIFDDFISNLKMLYENFVAQSLLAQDYEPFYFSWVDDNKGYKRFYEIDFVAIINGKTSPIEVKSSNNESIKTVDVFKTKYKKHVGTKYVIYPNEYESKDDTVYIPFYALFVL